MKETARAEDNAKVRGAKISDPMGQGTKMNKEPIRGKGINSGLSSAKPTVGQAKTLKV